MLHQRPTLPSLLLAVEDDLPVTVETIRRKRKVRDESINEEAGPPNDGEAVAPPAQQPHDALEAEATPSSAEAPRIEEPSESPAQEPPLMRSKAALDLAEDFELDEILDDRIMLALFSSGSADLSAEPVDTHETLSGKSGPASPGPLAPETRSGKGGSASPGTHAPEASEVEMATTSAVKKKGKKKKGKKKKGKKVRDASAAEKTSKRKKSRSKPGRDTEPSASSLPETTELAPRSTRSRSQSRRDEQRPAAHPASVARETKSRRGRIDIDERLPGVAGGQPSVPANASPGPPVSMRKLPPTSSPPVQGASAAPTARRGRAVDIDEIITPVSDEN
jgi:hypothetical protein